MSLVSAQRSRMLLEPEAAALLDAYAIPYVAHGMAATVEDALATAGRLGYPVVLKIVSADIVHKTEAGGVVLGLGDEAALRAGFEELLRRVSAGCPGARIDGVLVARQLSVRRELIVGGLRDATFGATVMVGLGGIFAEALKDVAFRVAPLRHQDGLDMLGELRAACVLAEFRGEAAVDLDALAAVLVRVGELLLARPQIGEIDLNPLAVSAEGCVALDARIIVREELE
jgi:succinyl-CoA synthetase beta subunit